MLYKPAGRERFRSVVELVTAWLETPSPDRFPHLIGSDPEALQDMWA